MRKRLVSRYLVCIIMVFVHPTNHRMDVFLKPQLNFHKILTYIYGVFKLFLVFLQP